MFRILTACLVASISSNVLAQTSTDIDRIFDRADFYPSIPARAGIESEYGKGKSLSKDGIEYVVYDIGNSRQMRLAYSEGNSASTTFVTEVVVCKCELADGAPLAMSAVTADSLLAIHIDDSSRVLERSHNRYRKSVQTIGQRRFEIYERNPVPDETDLYVRYLICSGRVMGFSVGVTE